MSEPIDPSEAYRLGETLAQNTTEALRVVRHGQWVYKFLKPHDEVIPFFQGDRRRELFLRILESHHHPEINPLLYDDAHRCIVSRFVAGHQATSQESEELVDRFSQTRRRYLKDCGPENIRITDRGAVLVDFVLAEAHRDWRARIAVAPHNLTLAPSGARSVVLASNPMR